MIRSERRATVRAAVRKYRASPKGQYTKHKINARRRGVEFKLTFEEWWDIWQKSGHWDKRGNRKGCYVMSRLRDEGPYAVGNVFIATFSSNVCDRNKSVAAKNHTQCYLCDGNHSHGECVANPIKRHTRSTTTVIFSDEPPF